MRSPQIQYVAISVARGYAGRLHVQASATGMGEGAVAMIYSVSL